MVYLTAAVILVGVLCALDLLLTVGVIRRLRVQDRELDALKTAQVPADTSLPPGTALPEFEGVDAGGAAVSRDGLVGAPALVAFMATDCHVCHDQLPQFTRYAGGMAGGRERVLAVVSGNPEDATDYTRQLEPVARVVLGADATKITRGFRVNLFPTFVLLDEQGVVSATRSAADQLPAEPVAG